MNIEWYIARRLLRGDARKSISVPIVKIATAGIAAGLCVMLLSVFVLTGFKQEITHKLSGFTAHFTIEPFPLAENNEIGNAIQESHQLAKRLKKLHEVHQAYPYIERPAIFKSQDEIHGVLTKGVDTLYDWSFFQRHLIAGRIPDFKGEDVSNEILLSNTAANYLKIQPGERLTAHFVQDPPRMRRFTVVGIYDTGFKEYDDVMVIVDRRHLMKLNNWQADEASGIAIELNNVEQLETAWEKIENTIHETGSHYTIRTLRDEAPQIFDWLQLLNMNVWVILILIVSVAGFNMVSGLLILILDKTTLIGLLKALGLPNVSLRRLFLYVASGLIARGMLWGNIVAFTLAGIQHAFHPIKLDPTTYYMSTVPIHFNGWFILILNAGVILVTVIMLIVPTMLISRIHPVKAIRYE